MPNNNEMADIPMEGENTFPEGTEEDTSTDSPAETKQAEENQTDENQDDTSNSDDQKSKEDDNVPFHQHPAWKRREEEWNTRLTDQETRHQEDIKKIRDEFSNARKDNAEQVEIPSWFGGDQNQWDSYRKWNDQQIKAAEERALDRLRQTKTEEDKAVKEATDYMQSELAAIESDTTLNPDGKKIDPNKILKVVMDNDLVDSKGHWNYRAGFRLIQQQNQAKTDPADRKKIAGATTSQPKGETTVPAFKTTDDFRNNRPW